MNDKKKIKEQPDTLGYYWVKKGGAWQVVRVHDGSNCVIMKTFDNESHYTSSYKEWIGPIFPDGVELFKTTPV
jgi:hypothetical protein